jgi:hypothetical protein
VIALGGLVLMAGIVTGMAASLAASRTLRDGLRARLRR